MTKNPLVQKQPFARDFRDADFDGAVSSAQLTIFPELATGAQKGPDEVFFAASVLCFCLLYPQSQVNFGQS